MNGIAKYLVTTNYERKDSNELTLKNGDVVEVLKKGKFIWYGRLNNTKGFFPSRVVSEIVNKTSFDVHNPGDALSSSAIHDNIEETAVCTDKTSRSMNPQSEQEFDTIDSGPPLLDERKLRARSAGRPPSDDFRRKSIMQRSDSMDNISVNSESDDSEMQTQGERNPQPNVPDVTSKVSQLVSELKTKPTIKLAGQKDVYNINNNTENSNEAPSWMKLLPRKKVSVPVPPSKTETPNVVPPWMQEIQRRKHKLSLRSDDEISEKVDNQTSKQTVVEVNSTKKSVIKSKSFNMQSSEINSTQSSFQQTRVVQSYSLLQNDTEGKDVIPAINNPKKTNKTNEPVVSDNTDPVRSSRPKSLDIFSDDTLFPSSEKVKDTTETSNQVKVNVSVTKTVSPSSPLDIKVNQLEVSKKVQSKEKSDPHLADLLKGSRAETKVTSTIQEVTISRDSTVSKENPDGRSKTSIISNRTDSSILKKDRNGHSEISATEVKKTETLEDLEKQIEELLNKSKNTTTMKNKPIKSNEVDSLPPAQKQTEAPPINDIKKGGETSKETEKTAIVQPEPFFNIPEPNTLKATKMITSYSLLEPNDISVEANDNTKSKTDEEKLGNTKEILVLEEMENKKENVQLQSADLHNTNNHKITSTVQSLLNQIEDYNVKHEQRCEEIRNDVVKLEMTISRQQQEMATFIRETKEKLSALVKT